MSSDKDSIDTYGDEEQLASFGYKQILHRTWHQFEAFMAGFGSLYVVGGARLLYSYGLYNGGPVALWTSMLVTVVFMTITAASLSEICSSIPLSGSIYVWAAEAGGRKYGRFFGFIVAYWSSTAWTSFVASNTQGTTNFMLTELAVFNAYFPGGGLDSSNVKFRAVQWIVSEAFLLIAILSNLLSPRRFAWIFKASALIIAVDFLLTVIWLPVGVSKTYGFQSAKWVFTEYYNGSGAPDVWNFMLVYLSTSGVLTGFDASGHIAEETKNASVASARGMFWSCVVSGLLAFPLLILFLFCSPSLDTLFTIATPQPFVIIYQLALGKGGQMVMTLVAIFGLLINTSLAVTAASRLIFAIARDGILPGSSWIGKVDKNGQPKNAIIFIGVVAALLLCTIIPSSVAFTSLISCGALPTIAAYALIPTLRLIFTRHEFANAKWSTGRLAIPFCIIAAIWNTFLMAVLLSPLEFPVTAQNFNFACAVFTFVTLAGAVSWWVVPEDNWLSRRAVGRILDSTEGKEGRAHPADRVQEGRAVVGEQGKKENEVEQATAAAH
ncbi:hypothetical protein NBRC10512_000650 [Rhodotorula toruloides]|nr:amino acid transmembrane transporter [Rhodotorula toruloides NP11]EMS20357.1 amino acid transmembrane transporter [Rhodotorula toruloides NP11]